METNAIVIQESQYASALVKTRGNNYELSVPNGETRKLKREVQFGNQKKKDGSNGFPQPILFKGGAEAIIHDYKVFPRYQLLDSIKDVEQGFFYYEFKCSLVAINPITGADIVVNEGVGNSNTRESKTGVASGFDQANSAMKNAKKRAMVDAAINLAGLSSIFTQDLENDVFQKSGYDMATAKPTDPITAKQRQRIYSKSALIGFSVEKTKNWLKAEGYESVKDIQQKDYDAICDKLDGMENENAG